MRGLPAAPLHSTTKVSLVLVSPSTVSMLNDRSAARFTAAPSSSDSTAASEVMKQSMVAMLGWIMRAPLLTPPTRTSRPPASKATEACLRRVSVVMMASLKASLSLPSWSLFTPSRRRSIGMGTPITPVDATSN